MAKTKTDSSFKPNGDLSLGINRWLLKKAKDAVGEGLSPAEGDFTWETFEIECDSLIDAIKAEHPSSKGDSTRKARNNLERQRNRFRNWLHTAAGYPNTFAQKAGLIASKLGGSLGAQKPGSDNDEDDEDSDVPLAASFKNKTPTKTSPKRTPSKKPLAYFNLNDLEEALEEADLVEEPNSDMQLKTAFLSNVPIKGESVPSANILVCQMRAPPGGVLPTTQIAPQADDSHYIDVSIDIDPNVSSGDIRTKEKWHNNNPTLAKTLATALTVSCEEDIVLGSNPKHARDRCTFKWPDDLKSQLNPIDPWKIGFRKRPSGATRPLYEVHEAQLRGQDGSVVPCYFITAFFLVDTPALRKAEAGAGLTINGSDSEADTPKSNGKRHRSGVNDDEM